MKTLHILWQRLLDADGKTCARCQDTQSSIERVMPKLRSTLLPLGMEPVLEVRAIAVDEFKDSPAESNRIWIAGRPIEDWLNASVGDSTCCSVCGGSKCRTLEIGGDSFEAIPEQLILKAALLAAAQSVSAVAERPGCCSTAGGSC